MKDIYLKPGTYIPKSTTTGSEIAGLSLENFVVSVINNPTCCPKISGGGSGFLKLAGGVNMTSTLTTVVDPSNNPSILQLSSNETRVLGLLSIKSDELTYINIQDNSGDDRFIVRRDPVQEQVNIDFASNPSDELDCVGAIRTYRDSVFLSEALSFTETGNVGVGLRFPKSLLHLRQVNADTILNLDRTGTRSTYLSFRHDNVRRIDIQLTPQDLVNPQSGSDLEITRYNDAGVSQGRVATIRRNTGEITVEKGLGIGVQSYDTLHPTVMLEVNSTTKGVLLPRMTTTQRNAMSSPPDGLLIYDTTVNKLSVRAAGTWLYVTATP